MKPLHGMLRLDPTKGKWVMSGVPPHIAIRLKNVFQRIHKWATDDFEFANDDITCVDLNWFASRYKIAISQADRKRLKAGCERFAADQDAVEQILLPDWKPQAQQGWKPGCGPRKHQSQFIEMFRIIKEMLLLDGIGLGKTYSAMGAMLLPGMLPAAVVVEAHLAKQWKEKIEENTFLKCHIIGGTKPYSLTGPKAPPPADVYIFRFSNVLGWTDIFATGFFQLAVYDEIQNLRTGIGSAKGNACRVLSNNVKARLGLSATPVYNYGIEAWHVASFIREGALGSHDEFVREWCGLHGKIVSDPDALGAAMREMNLVLRRQKGDVGSDVGDVNPIPVTIPYDEKAAQDVEDIARQLAMRVVSDDVPFSERGQASREFDMLLRQATGIAKARQAGAYVRMLIESGRSVLLGGWHRAVYDIWAKDLKDLNPVWYTGSESPAAKDKSKKAFMSGESKLLIMSIRSGSGADGLQFASSTAVVAELDWSPKVIEQFFGRLARDGQTEPVDGIYLICDGGSDPFMVELLGLKSDQSRGIVDPGSGVTSVTSDESRIKALATDFLKRRNIAMPEAPILEAA